MKHERLSRHQAPIMTHWAIPLDRQSHGNGNGHGPKNSHTVDLPLYNSAGNLLGLGLSNVDHLLKLNLERSTDVQAFYGQRIGGIPQGERMGILIEDFSHLDGKLLELAERGRQAAKDQARYIGALAGDENRITVFDPQSLRGELAAGQQVLLDPYINNEILQTYLKKQKLQSEGLQVNGLDYRIVERLKGKASFHEVVKSLKDPNFAVPHHEITPVEQVSHAAKKLLAFEEELYEATGMKNYDRGVVFRLDYSDGGFGSGRVVVDKETGKIRFISDSKESAEFDTWEEAFAAAQDYLYDASGNKENTPVIVSRLLKLKTSPGLSQYYMNGEGFSYGLNEQISTGENDACEGTQPLKRHNFADIEARALQGSKRLLKQLAKEEGADPDTITGPVNFDLMIHDQQELALQEQIVRGLRNGTFDSSLVAKLEYYGQLNEITEFTLAESNPRKTNYTAAIDSVMLVKNLPQTTASAREVMDNDITTEDKVGISNGVKINDLREALFERYRDTGERSDGGLVILRNVPVTEPKKGEKKTVGLIYTGNVEKRKQEFREIEAKLAA